MTKPVTFNRLISVLERTFAQLPDGRTGQNVTYSMRARMAITAFTAQRKVSRLVLERVSNLLCGEEPTWVVGDRVRRRVPDDQYHSGNVLWETANFLSQSQYSPRR